jgi:hypothetical protein
MPLIQGGWYQAWYEYEGAHGGFLSDLTYVENALKEYNDPLYQHQQVGDIRIGEVFGCALIRASIRTLNMDLPPELVVELVEAKIWSTERGINTAKNLLKHNGVKTLCSVASIDKQKEMGILQIALDVTKFINEKDRYEALKIVIAHLEGKPELLQQALVIARDMKSESDRVEALVLVAAHLSGQQKRDVLQEALDVYQGIHENVRRSDTLAALITQMAGQGELLQQVLDFAKDFKYESHRVDALTSVAAHLSDPQKKAVLDQALDATKNLDNKHHSTVALAAMIAQLEKQQKDSAFREVLDITEGIDDDHNRAFVLSEIVPYLEGQQKSIAILKILEAVCNIESSPLELDPIKNLAEYMDGDAEFLTQALDAAYRIKDFCYRAEALAAIAVQLVGQEKETVLQRALESLQNSKDEYTRTDILVLLATQLAGHEGLLQQGLDNAQDLSYKSGRAKAQAALAVHLPDQKKKTVLRQALDAVQSIDQRENLVSALAAVAVHLEGQTDLLKHALTISQSINDGCSRAENVSNLAKQLEGKQKDKVLQLALDAAQNTDCFEVLADLVVQLEGQQKKTVLQKVLDLAKGMDSGYAQVKVLSTLASHLAGQDKTTVLEQALTIAQSITDQCDHAAALAEVASQLQGKQKSSVLQQALDASQDKDCLRAQAMVAVQLKGQDKTAALQRTLDDAQKNESGTLRVGVLSIVASHIDAQSDLMQLAISIANHITDDFDRAAVHCSLSAQLQGEDKKALLYLAQYAAQGILFAPMRAEAWATLAYQLDKQQKMGLLRVALDIIFKETEQDKSRLHIPAEHEHSFRRNVNTDSGRT